MDTHPSLNQPSTNPSNTSLSINEVFREAWQAVHGFKGTFWLAILIFAIITIIFGVIETLFSQDNTITTNTLHTTPVNLLIVSVLISIASNIINYLLSNGLFYISLRRTANLPIMARMIFITFQSPYILKILAVMLIKYLIVFAYTIILILCTTMIPDTGHWHIALISCYIVFSALLFYIFVRLILTELIILDRKQSALSAISLSFRSTRGFFWSIFFIVILQILVLIISIIPLGIGLIWSLPLIYLIFPVIYKRLIGISMAE